LTEEILRLREECRRLESLARIDALTGYYNFRHFETALDGELERTRRTGLPTGMIVADLDHFKKVNDTHGHEAGNKVLAEATRLWRQEIRQIDIPCRYGGEEFVFILPGTRLMAAIGIAERLRKALDSTRVGIEKRRLHLTASFGVDAYLADEAISAKVFMERTDGFVFEAKQHGRNRVCYDIGRTEEPFSHVSVDEKKALLSGKL
jgi:diguanylate cyclase (GGDEF)-like protein